MLRIQSEVSIISCPSVADDRNVCYHLLFVFRFGRERNVMGALFLLDDA